MRQAQTIGKSTPNPCQFGSTAGTIGHMSWRTLVGSSVVVATFVALSPGLATATSGNVSGTVYRDVNANGLRDLPRLEVGQAGVLVTASDGDGRTWSAATDAAGRYSLAIDGAVNGSVRVQFASSDTWMQLGRADSADTQFVAIGTAGVDGVVSNPADYCQNERSLDLVTNCWKFGDQRSADRPAIVSFPTTASGVSPEPSAVARERGVGTTYGLAYQTETGNLFSGAYVRRYVGLGPAGTGGIYRSAKGNASTAEVWADLNVLFGEGTAGADPHPSAALGSSGDRPWYPGLSGEPSAADLAWFHDVDAWTAVGKVGLGDVELSDDEQSLFAVNLADRNLYRMSANVRPTSAGDIVRVAIPSATNCATTDSRPFALAFRDGVGYAGVVCSAESTGDRTQLRAQVFSFDPVTLVFDPVPALDVDLSARPGANPWEPWSDTLPRGYARWGISPWYERAEPMLTGIAFDGPSMMLGFRNRFSDRIAQWMGNNDANSGVPMAEPWDDRYGDTWRATWGAGRSGALRHSMGALVTVNDTTVPGGRVVATRLDAFGPYSNGVSSLDATHGWDLVNTAFSVYDDAESNGFVPRGGTLGKASGIGDLEALCNRAPIEIGDRLWNDVNGDGEQDPTEPGIGGVRLDLMQGGRVLASATTTASGGYLFSSGPGTSSADQIYGVNALRVGTSGLYVRIHTLPAGMAPTLRGAGSDAKADSNAYADNGSEAIALTVRGEVNRSIDFGLVAGPSTADPLYAVGDHVWSDVNGNGLQDVGEPGVEDIEVELWSGGPAGVRMSTTRTNANGDYIFSGLAGGDYRVVFVAPVDRFWTTPSSFDVPLRPDNPQLGTPPAGIRASSADLAIDAGLLPLDYADLPPT